MKFMNVKDAEQYINISAPEHIVCNFILNFKFENQTVEFNGKFYYSKYILLNNKIYGKIPDYNILFHNDINSKNKSTYSVNDLINEQMFHVALNLSHMIHLYIKNSDKQFIKKEHLKFKEYLDKNFYNNDPDLLGITVGFKDDKANYIYNNNKYILIRFQEEK